MGYEVLFCPSSEAAHVHRATISKHYAATEIERIFERNRCLFQLRNATHAGAKRRLMRRIAALDWRSFWEILRPGAVASTLAARLRNHFRWRNDRDVMDQVARPRSPR